MQRKKLFCRILALCLTGCMLVGMAGGYAALPVLAEEPSARTVELSPTAEGQEAPAPLNEAGEALPDSPQAEGEGSSLLGAVSGTNETHSKNVGTRYIVEFVTGSYPSDVGNYFGGKLEIELTYEPAFQDGTKTPVTKDKPGTKSVMNLVTGVHPKNYNGSLYYNTYTWSEGPSDLKGLAKYYMPGGLAELMGQENYDDIIDNITNGNIGHVTEVMGHFSEPYFAGISFVDRAEVPTHMYRKEEYLLYTAYFLDGGKLSHSSDKVSGAWVDANMYQAQDLVETFTQGGLLNPSGLKTGLHYQANRSFQIPVDIPNGISRVTNVKLTCDQDSGCDLPLQAVRIYDVGNDFNVRYDTYRYAGVTGDWPYIPFTGRLITAVNECSTSTSGRNYSGDQINNYGDTLDPIDNTGDILAVNIHVADIPGAGVSGLGASNYASLQMPYKASSDNPYAFLRGGLKDGYMYEPKLLHGNAAYYNLHLSCWNTMLLTIQYLDKLGATRTVCIPYTYSYIAAMCTQNLAKLGDSSKPETWLSGLMQQNDNAGFNFRLPCYGELIKATLSYQGYDVTTSKDGPTVKTRGNTQIAQKYVDGDSYDGTVSQDTSITIDSFAIYTGDVAKGIIPSVTSGLTADMAGSLNQPTYFKYYNRGGYTLADNSSVSLTADDMNQPWRDTADYTQEGLYLVEITADSNTPCTKDMLFTLHYTLQDGTVGTVGEQSSTWEYSKQLYRPAHLTLKFKDKKGPLRNQYTELGDDSNDNEKALIWKYTSTNRFLVTVDNLDTFDSIDLNYPAADNERYQINDIKIYEVSRMDKQTATRFKAKTDYPGHYLWSRNVTTTHLEGTPEWRSSVEKYVMFTAKAPSRSLTFDKVTANGELIESGGEEDDPIPESWIINRPESLTYEQTLLDLGLDVVKAEYDIEVDVADDDEAGSGNYFYFQLVFEDGVSGVVLANQQLESDTFRKGHTEVFHMKCAQDYGSVQAVRVICDTTSSTSDAFDKLHLRNIRVTQTRGGAKTCWEAENVGWIDINAQDERIDTDTRSGEKDSSLKLTNQQLVKEFNITSIATNLDLLFSIATSVDSAYDSLAKFSQKEIYIDFNYQDNTGQQKTKTSLLTDLIYTYDDFTDESMLFRKGHTDRFSMTFSDITSLRSVTLSCPNGSSAGDWVVDSISVSHCGELSAPYLDPITNEFLRNDSISPNAEMAKQNYICGSSSGARIAIGSGRQVMEMTENHITTSSGEAGNWSVSVTRLPTTTSESLNLYLFPGTEAVSGKKSEFTTSTPAIDCGIVYSTIYSSTRPMQQSTSFKMVDGDLGTYGTYNGETVLISRNVPITAMQNLQTIVLDTGSDPNSPIVRGMLVERIRSGFIVQRYWVGIGGGDLRQGQQGGIPGKDTLSSTMKQRLYLQVSPDQAAQLTAESYDIAVALRYTSEADSRPDDGKEAYLSPYSFLTDYGYRAVNGDRVLVLDYELPGVNRIAGINVVSSGPGVSFDSAVAYNFYTSDDGKTELKADSTYYRNTGFIGSAMATNLMATGKDKVVTPVTFTFTTPTSSPTAGTDAQVNMLLTYEDSTGALVERTVRNIAPLAGLNALIADDTPHSFTLLLPDCAAIHSVTMTPTSEDDWFISQFSIKSEEVTVADLTKTVQVNNKATLSSPLTIFLDGTPGSNTIKSMSLTATNAAGGQTAVSTGSEVTMTAAAGDNITFDCGFVYDGSPDLNVTWQLNGSSSSLTPLSIDWSDHHRATLIVPGALMEDVSYRVTVTSDSSGLSASILVTAPHNQEIKDVSLTAENRRDEKQATASGGNPASLDVLPGDVVDFTGSVTVVGEPSRDVTWKVNNSDTNLRTLVIAPGDQHTAVFTIPESDESGTSYTITMVSDADGRVYATVTLMVGE